MQKLVENLTIEDYDEVEDMLLELLCEHYGIEQYDFEWLEKDVKYVAGTINIVRLGDNQNTLQHKRGEQWTEDIKVSDSYRDATYYRVDKLNDLCENVLSGSWSETYNFNRILNEQ